MPVEDGYAYTSENLSGSLDEQEGFSYTSENVGLIDEQEAFAYVYEEALTEIDPDVPLDSRQSYSYVYEEALETQVFINLRLSRQNLEALAEGDAAIQLSRQDVEALWKLPPSTLRLSRGSIETLYQETDEETELRLSRPSVEVLVGPKLSRENWGAIPF